MLKELRFRYRHDGCWLQETTERNPDIQLVASAIYLQEDNVALHLATHCADPAKVAQAEAEWRGDERIQRIRPLPGGGYHVVYRQPGSMYRHILEHTPVSIGPVRIAGGNEYYHLVGEAPDLMALVATLEETGVLEMQSIRDADDVPGDEEGLGVFSELTTKQLEAVVLAQMGGYYQWPRRHTAQELADGLGVSSSAFLDHLRSAEGRIMARLVDELRMRDPGRTQGLRRRLPSVLGPGQRP